MRSPQLARTQKEKEIKMFTNRLFLKVMPASRALLSGLIVSVAIAVTTGFIRIQTDQLSRLRV